MSLVTTAINKNNMGYLQMPGIGQTASGQSFQSELNSRLKVPDYMEPIFKQASQTYGVSESLIKAVSKAESGFNPSVVSKAGAVGVMQLMPGTAKGLGVSDSFDPWQNIMGGAKYLRQQLDRYNGNVQLALAAYNAGPGAVDKYGGIPPYKETQNYVKKVTEYMGGNANTGYSQSDGLRVENYGGGVYLNTLMASANNNLFNAFSTMAASGAVSSDGESITISKDSFVSLVELLRLQMMSGSRSIGDMTII